MRFFKFKRYQDFLDDFNNFRNLIYQYVEEDDDQFLCAIAEAVCNAVRYSDNSVNHPFQIELHVDDNSIFVTVESKTRPFNTYQFYLRLRKYIHDKKVSGKTWSDLCGKSAHGRGIWLMLSACDFVMFDNLGDKVILHRPLKNASFLLHEKVCQLAHRFFVEDGVPITS